MSRAVLLENPVRTYAWGSRSVLPAMLGEQVPADSPWAEIWMGAHPADPSRLPDGRTLADVVPDLPYLVKLLAADEPLSVQAHPDRDRARAGYADEEARGVPLTAPHRTYKDPNHKPELLVALTRLDALVGFRRPEDVVALADLVGSPLLYAVVAPLRGDGDVGDRLRASFGRLLTVPGPQRARLVGEVATAVDRIRAEGPDTEVGHWVARLAADRPDDPGVLAPLFLRLVVLDPGDALFLAPGVLHAYLHGAGVEVQASSDNVVRGGLTPKHVDVSALLDVVVYDDGPPPHVRPRPVAPGVDAYDVPVPDFAVWRVRPKGEERDLPGAGPRVVVCVEGSVTVDGLPIAQGRAAYVDVERGEGDADRDDVAEPRVGGDGTCFVVAPGR